MEIGKEFVGPTKYKSPRERILALFCPSVAVITLDTDTHT